MEFLTENYLWIIIVGVVLLMALVGFIAEKTNFGRKEEKEDSKTKEKKEVIQPIVATEPVVEEQTLEPRAEEVAESDVVDNDISSLNFEINPEQNKDLNEEIDPLTLSELSEPLELDNHESFNAPLDDDLYQPLEGESNEAVEENNEELDKPLESNLDDDSKQVEIIDLEPGLNNEEDINTIDSPVEESIEKDDVVEPVIEDVVEEEPITENVETEKNDDIVTTDEIPLPDINNVNEKKDEIEDDVWRF